MCFRQSRAAKSTPLSRRDDFFRARTRDKTRMPYKNPLYWKCMWSMIKSPGDNNIDNAAAWDARLDTDGEV